MIRKNKVEIKPKDKYIRFLMSGISIIITYILLVSVIAPKQYDLKEGDIARVDIKASRDTVNELATQEKIKEATEKIDKAYTLKGEVQSEVQKNINRVLNKVSNLNTTLEDEKDKLYAYLNGLLIHYCLDRNTHPYIFYRTGNIPSIEKNDPNYYMRSHVFFESNVDVLIANHMKLSKNNVKAIKNNKEDVKIISKMYKAINDELFKYDFIKEDTFYLCYLDMLSIEKLFYSPLGIKRLFYYPFRKKIQLWVQTNPVKPYHNQEIDYLNLKKNSWKYPDTGIETDDSFFDLVEKAREDLNIVNKLFENKTNDNLKQKINLFINNINHDGCKIGLEKSYFDFCYKLIKKVPF